VTAPAETPTPVNGSDPAAAEVKSPTSTTMFDIDALEREGGPDPFVFAMGGRTYTMRPRDEIPWQDLLLAMRNPVLFIRFTMSPEDHEAFLDTSIPMWKMDKLMEAYLEHFGIDAGEFSGSSGF
jgi:hypothetical protein